MKKILFVFLIGLVTFSINAARAQEKSTFEKILLFGSGYLTGHLVHEAGHQVTAWTLGVPLRWRIKSKFSYIFWGVDRNFGYDKERYWYTWNNKTYSLPKQNSDFRKIGVVAMGGLGAEIISSEIILATSSLRTDKNEINYFLLGLITQTIANPIIYSIADNNTFNKIEPYRGTGDLRGIEKTGYNKKTFKAVVLTHSALTLARTILKLRKQNAQLPNVALTQNGFSLIFNLN